jgi:hypothetical protein
LTKFTKTIPIRDLCLKKLSFFLNPSTHRIHCFYIVVTSEVSSAEVLKIAKGLGLNEEGAGGINNTKDQ